MLKRLQENNIEFLVEKLNALSDRDKKLFHPHEFTKEKLQELLTEVYNYYFLLEKDEGKVGYSMLRTFGKYPIPTYGQVIWQEHRGKGYGSEILEETLEEAKGIGFEIVRLKVYPHNKTAHSLYLKHGFKEIRREGGEIWMERSSDLDTNTKQNKEVDKK